MVEKRRVFSKAELEVFSELGITAGQVTFGSLFLTLFSENGKSASLLIFSSLLTAFCWGLSWFLAKRFRV